MVVVKGVSIKGLKRVEGQVEGNEMFVVVDDLKEFELERRVDFDEVRAHLVHLLEVCFDLQIAFVGRFWSVSFRLLFFGGEERKTNQVDDDAAVKDGKEVLDEEGEVLVEDADVVDLSERDLLLEVAREVVEDTEQQLGKVVRVICVQNVHSVRGFVFCFGD